MDTTKRYDCCYNFADECAEMRPDELGEYVSFSDYEALQKRELYYKEHMEAEQRARVEEVERLKKELEDNTNRWMEHSNKAFIEGERRAMQRVKDAIDVEFDRHTPTRPSVDCIEMESARTTLSLLKARLGLGEEEQP